MNTAHRLAELLVVTWKLGAGDDRIPTSHGILDRALNNLCNANLFPTWAQNELHFTDSRVGLQCVELPSILEWAQRSQLTSAPNPSYETTQIVISTWLAETMVDDTNKLGIDLDQAKKLGRDLADAVVGVKTQLNDFEFSQIEEY